MSLLLGLLLCASLLYADNSAFDLTGPKIDVHVKRGAVTLPISQVPNLLPGDRLWVHPDFPESQTNRFVLVVAFLRGSTNQPPNDWFTRVETWSREAREEGIFVTVPQGAQQALLFLAPETGGDFTTLRKAVHDRPGAFVRADQDLQTASWERSRLEAYLAEVKETSQTDQKALKERTQLAARSLGIKVDANCFDKPADEQASCLGQQKPGMVLDDSSAQGLVSQITNGSTADLMNQLSYSTMGGAGMYSPYIGAVVDMAKILSSLHTAHFQYIPALALPTKDTMNLRLNVPPSFRDPKSVVVIALPPVGPTKPPPLRPISPEEVTCAQKPDLVLPADGAPLVFATPLAHDLSLRIESPHGPIDIPVQADPAKGGIVFSQPLPPLPTGGFIATLRGKWGFDDWEGPRFHLYSATSSNWSVVPGDESALVVGREDTLHIQGEGSECVSEITLHSAGKSPVKLSFKQSKPRQLALTVPLKDASPGQLTLAIHQYGVLNPDSLTLNAYSEAASLESMTLSVGDRTAALKGNRLDEVAKASFDGISWSPAGLTRVSDFDRLALKTTSDTSHLTLTAHYDASVSLRDGRELKIPVTLEPPRPQVALLNKGTQTDGTPTVVQMGSPDDLPLNSKLVFFLKSVVPSSFPRDEKVEVASDDGSFHTTLSIADGSLMLEDAQTALGSLKPMSKFGPSAFGPLHVRVISADGVPGEWMPLGTLVRVPSFTDLRCPRSVSRPCTLTGMNLFLATAVGSAQDMNNAVNIPPDFTGTELTVPHPAGGALYLKLRDDPDTVQTLSLPITWTQPPLEARARKHEKNRDKNKNKENSENETQQPNANEPPAPTTVPLPAQTAPSTTTPATPQTNTAPSTTQPAAPSTATPQTQTTQSPQSTTQPQTTPQ